jgi:hypothetical protein
MQIFFSIIVALVYVGAAFGFNSALKKLPIDERTEKLAPWQMSFGRGVLSACWPAAAAYVWAQDYLG